MIDRAARKELSELLRHFVSGRIDNFTFEKRVEEIDWNDRAVREIAIESWCLYDDVRRHHLTGKWRLIKSDRRIIARWILFLQSDLEMEWPRASLRRALKRAITVLTGGAFPQFREPKYEDLGDYDCWPFFRQTDFERAVAHPKLLAGKASR